MKDYSIIAVSFISPIASVSYPNYHNSELPEQSEPECGTFNTAPCCEASKLWDNECHDCERAFFWDELCHDEPETHKYSVSTKPGLRSEQPDLFEYAEWPEQTEYTEQPKTSIYTKQSEKDDYTEQSDDTEYFEPPKYTKYTKQPEKAEYTQQPEYTQVIEQPEQTESTEKPEQTESTEQPVQSKQPELQEQPSTEHCNSKGNPSLKYNLNLGELSDKIHSLDQKNIKNTKLSGSNSNLDHDLEHKKLANVISEHVHCQKSGVVDLELGLNLGELTNLNLNLGLLKKCHLISLGINLGLPEKVSPTSSLDDENCKNIGLIDLALGLDLIQLLNLVIKGILGSILKI